MSSFLGRQFYRSTLYKKKKRKPVFIKQKWNQVVFSWATILSFQPVEFKLTFSNVAVKYVSYYKDLPQKLSCVYEWRPRSVAANMLDCDIIINEFELQCHYFVHIKINTLVKSMISLNPLWV